MNIGKESIAQLCRFHGTDLSLPAASSLDGAQILWAIAGAESSFGQDTAPRHEPGYCRGGKYFDATLTKQWGCLAHCSYGPWQVLYVNYPAIEPMDLIDGAVAAEYCIRAAVKRLNIALHQGATELAQLADAYNSGNFRDAIVPAQYIADVQAKYQIQMPAPVAAGEN